MLKQLVLLIGLIAVTTATAKFALKDGKKTCFLLEADVEGEIKWKEGNETKSYKWNLDPNQQIDVDGACSAKKGALKAERMNVKFLTTDSKSAVYATQWIFELTLTQNDNKTYELVDWSLTTKERPGLNFSRTYQKAKEAVTDVSAFSPNGYKCSNAALALEEESVVTLKYVRAVGFASIDGEDFPSGQVYEVCSFDSKTSDIVPIIVGACLAGLVVVVLVAYLVGRARARRQGYASV